jgi:hypothetical protein
MYKFSLSLLLSLSILLSGSLYAVDYVWDAGGDGYSWHDGLNWDLDVYPNYFSQNVFIAGPQYSSGLDANTTVAANNIYLSHADYGDGGTLTLEPNSVLNVNSYLYMGSESGGENGVINIDGGTLNIGTSGNGLVKVYGNGHVFNLNSGTVDVNTSTSWAGYFRMGHVAMTPDSVTTINIHGGTLNAEGIKLGYYYNTGTHNLNMTGGTLNLAHLDLSDADYTTAHVQFDGGTINISSELWVNNNSDHNKNGTVDMTGSAKLVLNGDRVSRINGWISDGRLTASAGDTFDVSYDSVTDKTVITVKSICPAGDCFWDAGGDGYSWHDALNWNLDLYPDSISNNVYIVGQDYAAGIDANTSVTVGNIYLSHGDYVNGGAVTVGPDSIFNIHTYLNMGSESGGEDGVVNVDGGTLNIGTSGNGSIKVYGNGHVFNLNSGTVNVSSATNWAGWFQVGQIAQSPDSVTTINVNGGTLNAVGIKLGYYYNSGTHNLNMTGGTLNLAHLDIADADYTTAHVQFDGGTINILSELWLNNSPDLHKNGTMEMTGDAKLVLNGDRVGRINGWINEGRLTVSDGDVFDVSYDNATDKTIVAVSAFVYPYSGIIGDINGDFIVDYNDLYFVTNDWLYKDYDSFIDGTVNADVYLGASEPRRKIVGYCMGGWQAIYKNATCINVAFQRINDDGSLGTLTPGESNLTEVVSSAHENGVKVVISVGGGYTDQYYNFQTVAASSTLRTTLISNLANFVSNYDLDGVDIDWERPSAGAEVDNYVLLIQGLYNEFHPKGKLVTTALTANADSIVTWLPTSVFDSLDYVNIMSYGVTAERLTYSHFVDGMNLWLNKGLPAEKIVMGIPFYGRHEDTDEQILYRDIITLDSDAPYKDYVNGYIYNGLRTARRKTRLAIDNNCAGVMIWQLPLDKYENKNVSLLKAICSEIDLEGLEFYSTQFDNDDVLDDWSGKNSWSSYWSLNVGLGEGQLVTTVGNQNTSVWYDATLPDGNSPYDLQDYVVTAEIDASNGFTHASVTARVTDASNFYQFKYNPDDNTIVLLVYSNGICIGGVDQSVTETIPEIYTLSLMVSGDTLKGKLVDPVYGEVLATVSTTNTALTSGTAGFRAYNTTAQVNNFRINQIRCSGLDADLNGDCNVNIEDFAILAENWIEE